MNLVTWSVFGVPANAIPSPLGRPPQTTTTRHPRNHHNHLRHLLIGCQKEVFGWTWWDGTFCTQAYHEWLTSPDVQMEARYTLLEGGGALWNNNNHWSMLSSRALAQALKDDLPWLLRGSDDDDDQQQQQQPKNNTLCGLESSDSSTTTTTEANSSSSGTLSSSDTG
jgi:hypothetical protein